MREITEEEVDNVDGAVLPVMFLGAAVLSQVSWGSVAYMAGTMTGIGVTGAVLYNTR